MANIPPESGNPFQSPRPLENAAPRASIAPSSASRLGEILGRAFTSYGNQWGQWPLPMLLCAVIALVCYLACFFPFVLAQGPLSCALFACALRNLRGWPVDTSALGRGWQIFWPAMGTGLALTLLQLIPMVVIFAILGGGMALFGATMAPKQPGGQPDPAVVLPFMFSMMAVWMAVMFVMMVWTFFFATRTMFVLPLVADRGYGFFAAWHASWDATRRRFWERLLLVVLAGILGGLGVYACYVGVVFTLPLYYLIIAAAYEDEFGIGLEQWTAPTALPEISGESPFLAGGDPAR